MANKKKIATVAGAMVLTAVLAVGGTLAYLSSITETAKNKFSSDKSVNGSLTEEGWDYGEEGWKDYTPGEVQAKKPIITMDQDNRENAYVGVKIVCHDNAGNVISFEEFSEKYATVQHMTETGSWKDGIDIQWKQISTGAGKDFWVLNRVLTPGQSASPFGQIQVNVGISKVYQNNFEQKITITKKTADGVVIGEPVSVEKGEWIQVGSTEKVYYTDASGKEVEITNAKLPSFQLDVTGYAIQETGTLDTHEDMLKELAGIN